MLLFFSESVKVTFVFEESGFCPLRFAGLSPTFWRCHSIDFGLCCLEKSAECLIVAI
jgi:hypothetical protein